MAAHYGNYPRLKEERVKIMERGIIDQAEYVDFRIARKICEDHGADIEEFLETQAEMDNIDTTELFTWLGY